jgi:hypothetical protein
MDVYFHLFGLGGQNLNAAFKPAVAFAAAAEPDVVMLVAVTAPKAEAPVTVRLSNDGSA